MAGVPDVARRKKAFELYAQYKNMSKVAKELKTPTQTILKWKQDDKWEEKLARLRSNLQGQIAINEKAQDDLMVEKDLYRLKTLDLLDQKVAEAIEGGQVRISTWKDVISTMEFTAKERRLIVGEPTERADSAIEVSFTKEEELDERIKDLQRHLNDSKSES